MTINDNRGKGYASKFRMHRIANQNIPSGAFTTIQFTNAQFDTLGETDTTIAYSWTPRETGYYLIHAKACFQGLVAGTRIYVRILTTGGNNTYKHTISDNALPEVVDVTEVWYIQAGDVVTVQARQDSGFNQNIQGGVNSTCFEGFRFY